MSNKSRFACGHDWPAVGDSERLVVGALRGKLIAILHGENGEPTPTDRFGAQLMAQYLLNWVRKLKKRDGSLSRCGTSISMP